MCGYCKHFQKAAKKIWIVFMMSFTILPFIEIPLTICTPTDPFSRDETPSQRGLWQRHCGTDLRSLAGCMSWPFSALFPLWGAVWRQGCKIRWGVFSRWNIRNIQWISRGKFLKSLKHPYFRNQAMQMYGPFERFGSLYCLTVNPHFRNKFFNCEFPIFYCVFGQIPAMPKFLQIPSPFPIQILHSI